jgi:hypothetical protein
VDEALEAAAAIGFPVALKITGQDHKTEAGGVLLSITDAQSLTTAYSSLSERFGPQVVVQAMSAPGIEMALGIVRDEQFGPVVVVAAGGVYVELMKDRRLGMPPLDDARAYRLLDGLQIRSLLDGFRGSQPCDVDSLARAIVGISHLAADIGEYVEALDVNPVVVSQRGAVAVDGLVIQREPSRASS